MRSRTRLKDGEGTWVCGVVVGEGGMKELELGVAEDGGEGVQA